MSWMSFYCLILFKDKQVLRNLNLEIKENELLAVIGQVGSGKSSLLMSIMNEIPFISADHFSVNGSMFYVAQEPWIFSGSLKQNILFGKEFIKSKFDEIVQVCCLDEVNRRIIDIFNCLSYDSL